MINFLALLLAFYLWHTFGVTIGLHRLLSHRSFKCPKWLEHQWVIAAYLAFHGSPIWWATMHRAHHRHVDTPLDPHAPKFGMYEAYAFYLPFKYADHIEPRRQSRDLLADPLYRALECGGNWRVGYALNVVICVGFRLALWALFGWQVALASFIAGIMALNVPLILNVVCHIPKLGNRNFNTVDDSVNVWWMAVICLGEGWHNNHHALPGSPKSGVKDHEIDASWIVLRSLEKIGLVSGLETARRMTVVPALRVIEGGKAAVAQLDSAVNSTVAVLPVRPTSLS
jgi:stearoyl-CoA desaturase (delta-9 desaturase)